MYVSVTWIIAGQALLFGQIKLLAFAALVGLGFHLFVLLYEEPALRGRFGPEYERYTRAVPRWMPRLRPWDDHS
jgi:protein-S-isoprenylcysteine O-methyltransferase Ste14